jgi:hypothetical protein
MTVSFINSSSDGCGPAWTKKCPPDIMRRLDLAGDEVPSCVTPRHVAQLAEAEHDADEWQAALMLVAEHEPQRPRPPDLYIRGRAGRSSADLSAQPERYHIKLHFRPARKVPRLRENFGCDFVGDRTDICNLASSATRRERRARSKRARPG